MKTSLLTIFVLCFLHTVDAVGKQVNVVHTKNVKVDLNEEADKEVIGDVDTEVIVVDEEPNLAVMPAAEEPAAEEPAAEEPAAEEPAAEEPAVEEPAVEEPAAEEFAVEEPAAEEPAAEEPAAEEPAAEEPAAEEPAAEEPAAEEPAAEESAAEEPAAEEPAAEEPAAEEPAAEEPAAEEPAAEEPAAEEPAAEEPAAEEPAAEEPAAEEPAAEEPADEEPAAEEPTDEEPFDEGDVDLGGYEAADDVDASGEDVDADAEEVDNCDLSNFIHCSVIEAIDEGRTDDMDKLLAIPTSLNFAMKLLPSESNFLVVNGMNNFDYESADYEDVVKALELGRSEVINTCIMHGEEGTTKLLASEKISLLYTFLIERVQMELKGGPNYMDGTHDESIKPGSKSIRDIRNAKKAGDWHTAAAIAASPRDLKHGWKLLPGSLRRKLVLAKNEGHYDVMNMKIDDLIQKASELVDKVQASANLESVHGYHCTDNDELCFAIDLLEFYKFYKQKQVEKYFETPTLPSCAAA